MLCQKGIDDVAQHFLSKHGILACRRVKKSDMEALVRATGARLVSSLNDLSASDLGFAGVVREQKICLYGIDDIWYKQPTFKQLPTSATSTPLIFLTHNPDGILYWPENKQKPDLVLSGHSHGGQILLPFIGPLGNPGIGLGVQYYKGLNYYKNIPIFTSTGIGESGGPIRLFVPPEIAIIELWF